MKHTPSAWFGAFLCLTLRVDFGNFAIIETAIQVHVEAMPPNPGGSVRCQSKMTEHAQG